MRLIKTTKEHGYVEHTCEGTAGHLIFVRVMPRLGHPLEDWRVMIYAKSEDILGIGFEPTSIFIGDLEKLLQLSRDVFEGKVPSSPNT